MSPSFAAAQDDHQHDETERTGPNGGKLLTNGDFSVEITIYESGMPPEMRVYAYYDNERIDPSNVDLEVTLHRLGNQNDKLTFTTDGDYLVSNEVVTEPHSYEVSVEAAASNDNGKWHYEAFEGRAVLSDRIIEKANIQIERAQAQTLRFKERLFGVVAPVNDRQIHVTATYRGEISAMNANIGDKVSKGQTLAVVTNASSGAAYQLVSPIDGVITERLANSGEVAAEQILFEIVDLSKVWIELSAFPENIEKLAVGQQAEVFDLHQHERVTGEIVYIAPVMTGGHIARARVLIDNSQGHWRPGMHVQADVVTDEKEVALAVKKDALQTFRDMPVVFAQYGNTFEVRMVELGKEDNDYVEVLGGLKHDTPYVYGNSYLLKADVLKDGASHDH
ncbi:MULTISPECIES: efflux RND transporter periplasmic adaptor subunit [Idiomarina]|nr:MULTISPECIES: efflux RND transporter periplasmic adaptor subunit [Idiomarina]